MNTDLEATQAMCYHCFDSLLDELLKSDKSGSKWRKLRQRPVPEYAMSLPDPSIECPIFVTWEKARPVTGFPGNLIMGNGRDSNGQPIYELRGCIGTLNPKPLLTAVGDYALSSALRDRRFQPVTPSEVSNLRVSVSLLVKYEPCQDCLDWVGTYVGFFHRLLFSFLRNAKLPWTHIAEVGTHGILIKFWNAKREYSATYLPEVAKDQKWEQKTAVTALIRKSGYTGAIDQDLFDSIQCTR